MSLRIASTLQTPDLLPGRIVHLPGRGEMFVRHHQHRDSTRPTLLLLHGWTASCDTQFFTAYELSNLYQRAGFDQVRCGVLDSAAPDAFPRGDDSYIHLEDLDIGPMDAEQHKGFLAREFVVLGTKAG